MQGDVSTRRVEIASELGHHRFTFRAAVLACALKSALMAHAAIRRTPQYVNNHIKLILSAREADVAISASMKMRCEMMRMIAREARCRRRDDLRIK